MGASKQVFADARTGAKREHLCASFPFQSLGGNDDSVSRVRHVSTQNDALAKVDNYPGEAALFGLHTLRDAAVAGSSQVVLTASEWDAMAVRQATGLPAVALPSGHSTLPISALPPLERFGKVVLWFSNDVAGQDAVDKFARKLGRDRCFIVVPPADNIKVLVVDVVFGFDAVKCNSMWHLLDSRSS